MKFYSIMILLVLLIGDSASLIEPVLKAQISEEHSTRFPGSRGTWQGDVFMSWPFPAREWFVEGALAGYKVGYVQGCEDIVRNTHTRATNDCPNRCQPQNRATFYAEEMTDFYTKYPRDRDLPVAFLIQMLIQSKPKTVDEIHAWMNGPK